MIPMTLSTDRCARASSTGKTPSGKTLRSQIVTSKRGVVESGQDLPPRVSDRRIHELRGHNVLLDEDLAALYGVQVKVLNQAVARNIERFPRDFMFRVTREEASSLRSQSAGLKKGRGGRRYLPLAFTEEGVAMLSSVLRSERAVQVNIEVMRAFVRMRTMVGQHRELAKRIDSLEEKYDVQFKEVFDAIREMMIPLDGPERRIGFPTEGKEPT